MRAGVLFAGIGGWEIACELNSVEVAWAAEWDVWKRERYLERWPAAALYRDVAGLSGDALVRDHGPIDILLGSPPCTDISAANAAGRGLDGDESRYYLEAIRLARETGARWVGFENSPRLRTRGSDRVLTLLGVAGYACWPCVVAAEDAGAPHIRSRSFVLGCRRDAIARADTERAGVRVEPGRSGGAAEPQADDPDAAGLGAARQQAAAVGDAAARPIVSRADAVANRHRQSHGAVDGEMGRRAGADVPAGECSGEAADVQSIGRGQGARQEPSRHPDRARLAEWQGVGGDAREKLSPAQRAALSPWDQRGDGLAGYLSVAHGLADRLRGHGLSERAVKGELARWRSALGDALVIPVVWAVVRSIVRTDKEWRRE